MYTLNPLQTYVEGEQYHDRDQTIEILMDELDTGVMDIFYKRGGETADTATKVTTQTRGRYSALPPAVLQRSGISELVPGMKMDTCLFDPCGYSMNAIAKQVTEGRY